MSLIDYKIRPRIKRNKKTLLNETKSAVRALVITLFVMIVVLTVGFIALTNENAQKGYALEQAKLRNADLKTKNENLETQITNSTAFANIEENDIFQAMKEPEQKKYVTDEDNRVK